MMAIALDRESSDSTDVAHIAVGARQMPTALMSRNWQNQKAAFPPVSRIENAG